MFCVSRVSCSETFFFSPIDIQYPQRAVLTVLLKTYSNVFSGCLAQSAPSLPEVTVVDGRPWAEDPLWHKLTHVSSNHETFIQENRRVCFWGGGAAAIVESKECTLLITASSGVIVTTTRKQRIHSSGGPRDKKYSKPRRW